MFGIDLLCQKRGWIQVHYPYRIGKDENDCRTNATTQYLRSITLDEEKGRGVGSELFFFFDCLKILFVCLIPFCFTKKIASYFVLFLASGI